MGVPEGNIESDLGRSDLERVLNVIQKTDVSLHKDNLHIRRLGTDTSRAKRML